MMGLELESMEWISVKDKMPKDVLESKIVGGPDVLVSSPRGVSIACQYKSGEFVGDGFFPIKGVTHWMPIPPPPNEE